jgi:hypothetical protein
MKSSFLILAVLLLGPRVPFAAFHAAEQPSRHMDVVRLRVNREDVATLLTKYARPMGPRGSGCVYTATPSRMGSLKSH